MKEWTGNLNITNMYECNDLLPMEQVLLFDIETTGFSAMNTICYMIGYCYVCQGSWHYRMLFNDDGKSEFAMLDEFLKVLNSYSILIHYNGDGFDIPYLTEKIKLLSSSVSDALPADAFTSVQSIDLYKVVKRYKKNLKLPNLKLPTVEAAMHMSRADHYTGGELISVYYSYLTTHSDTLEHELYQHNYEDILAMIPLLSILHFQGLKLGYWQIYSIQLHLESNPHLRIQIQLDHELPFTYSDVRQEIQIQCEGRSGIITIPLIYDELYYYIENWKDYYYLPLEGTVVHKSVASFVDSAYKEKAKRSNCYIKKTATFLPLSFTSKQCPKIKDSMLQLKIYKRSFEDKACFVELNEELNQNLDFFTYYIKHLF